MTAGSNFKDTIVPVRDFGKRLPRLLMGIAHGAAGTAGDLFESRVFDDLPFTPDQLAQPLDDLSGGDPQEIEALAA